MLLGSQASQTRTGKRQAAIATRQGAVVRSDTCLPVGQIACADNLAFTSGLPDGCCDLIYADPPFFTNREHTQSGGGQAFHDRWPDGMAGYLDFLRPRLETMRRLLKPTGSLYVHVDWRTVHHLRLMLDQIFGEDHFLNEIVWSYRTGGAATRWFARKHDTLLAYARTVDRQKFHIQRGGEYRTDGMNVDEQGRPYKTTKAGRLYFHPDGPTVTDVWEIPFLSTVSLERTGYPTQKPEALLERIIRATTDPGDVVADFFCGSGTTLAAAQRLNRRWMGCDSSPQAVKIARKRLETPLRQLL